MNIFAYGTLLIPCVMYAVTAREFRFKNAILKGYARFTVKGESYPGIIPVADAVTKGIVYFDVDKLSLERLDDFEGNLYQRKPVRVETEEREIRDAKTYVIKPEYRGCLSWERWDVRKFIQKDLEAFLETCSGFQKNL
ncbi:MAG: gamma-glutamylcyclotransferase [Desulfobacteraceae bacterium]|nr:gamma-glutamylcyclotransferase [Desulfobacteraceae bacterium]